MNLENINRSLINRKDASIQLPGVSDLLDFPINLNPAFSEFIKNIKDNPDLEYRNNLAKGFFDDFLTIAELAKKTLFIEDVKNYEANIKQLLVAETIPVVKKHKDLVSDRIDEDILLRNKASDTDIFFKNRLERLYESLKDYNILNYGNLDHGGAEPLGLTKMLKEPINSNEDKEDFNLNTLGFSYSDIAYLCWYKNETISPTNNDEKSEGYGLKVNKSPILYNRYSDACNLLHSMRYWSTDDIGKAKGLLRRLKKIKYISADKDTHDRIQKDIDKLCAKFNL